MIFNGWSCFVCIFQIFFWRNLTTQLQSDSCEPIILHVIGLTTHLLSIEWPDWSCAPALWYHDCDVSNQNMALLTIFQLWLAMFAEEKLTSRLTRHNVNMLKSVPIQRGRSKDSRWVGFFLVNARYFFKKLQSPKLHFYLVLMPIGPLGILRMHIVLV